MHITFSLKTIIINTMISIKFSFLQITQMFDNVWDELYNSTINNCFIWKQTLKEVVPHSIDTVTLPVNISTNINFSTHPWFRWTLCTSRNTHSHSLNLSHPHPHTGLSLLHTSYILFDSMVSNNVQSDMDPVKKQTKKTRFVVKVLWVSACSHLTTQIKNKLHVTFVSVNLYLAQICKWQVDLLFKYFYKLYVNWK